MKMVSSPVAPQNNNERPSSVASHLRGLGSSTMTITTEIRLFLELAIPSALVSAGNKIGPLLIASYVGRRFTPSHLAGYTLANLTGNLCTFSVSSGLFSASDTLGPQAFGIGNYREVGLIAVRGFVVANSSFIPINIGLYFWMEPLLILLGQDEEAALYASQWYKVFLLSLPFCILYNCIWKFLSAQHIMRPPTAISLLSCFIILPLSLEVLTNRFGYVGSAYAYVQFQSAQALLMLAYLYFWRPHVAETWPSSSSSGASAEGADNFWRDAIFKTDALWEFVHLGLGGIFAQSEWLFWEALGLLVGLLGVLPLSVHTIPNQVTSTLCFPAFAAGTALAIRMGVTFPQSVERTKQLALVTVVVFTVLDGILQWVVYNNSETIISFFTNQDDAQQQQQLEITELAQEIWWKVCTFNWLLALFAILTGVATGLGKQWALGNVNFFFLFVVGLPATYYFGVVAAQDGQDGGGLEMIWTTIMFPYLAINTVLLIHMFIITDWDEVQKRILLSCRNSEDGREEEEENSIHGEESEQKAWESDQEAQLLSSPVMIGEETQTLLGSPSSMKTYGAR